AGGRVSAAGCSPDSTDNRPARLGACVRTAGRRGTRMLRYRADRRSIAYLATAAILALVHWNWASLGLPLAGVALPGVQRQPILYALSLFLGVATAVISHNHNHLSMWKSRPANLVTSWVISVFYGHPAIGWVPTHNMVHHRFNNRPGDSSRCPKVFTSNHLL